MESEIASEETADKMGMETSGIAGLTGININRSSLTLVISIAQCYHFTVLTKQNAFF